MSASATRRVGAGRYRSASAEATIAFGRVLGSLLEPGDVLVLTGDLGAGKTQLTKGIAAGMGVMGDVCSPTFTIGMSYEGTRCPLYHFDLYRLEHAEQLEDTGLFDVLGGDGPCVIEWGEQFAGELGDERLDVLLTRVDAAVDVGDESGRFVRALPSTDVSAGVPGATAPSTTTAEPERELRLVPHGIRARQLVAALDQRLAPTPR